MSILANPDFNSEPLAKAPNVAFQPAPADGVLPEGFFSTTNLPTWVKIDGKWKMPREPRMDAALVLDKEKILWTREGRRVKCGDLVAIGKAETSRLP